MRIFSGVQPTGDLHLGNYLGAIKQFVALQQNPSAECLYCVVDMHAITAKHNPALLKQQTREIAAAYLACGVDDLTSTIFVQSQVPAHAELAWLLNCVTRMGWMERMTQFKDKAGESKERASVGLFTYPILMAADILAYKATHVPVGDDQKQHLNLARDVAEKFNHDFSPIFPVPDAVHSESARIMSLQNASNKMSKSDPDPLSRVNLSDTNDVILKKIRRATATTETFPSTPEAILRPEITNLIGIYAAMTGDSHEAIHAQFGGQGYGVFKPALADAIISVVSPIRDEMARIMLAPDLLDAVLHRGAEHANQIASATVREAKQAMGFLT